MLSRAIVTEAKDGRPSPAAIYECNKSSNGELALLLSNRSLAHLRLGDANAAVEDAEACVQADTTIEKGHMRLLLALEAHGASAQMQLEACERGLQACPDGPLLSGRQQRLAKTVKAQVPSSCQHRPRVSIGRQRLLTVFGAANRTAC
jgi:predicted O-linked N-acetylglucosamine transferase (SPINDLY family)